MLDDQWLSDHLPEVSTVNVSRKNVKLGIIVILKEILTRLYKRLAEDIHIHQVKHRKSKYKLKLYT